MTEMSIIRRSQLLRKLLRHKISVRLASNIISYKNTYYL